ncbi:MAG: aminoacetone oxidase family FAD-binding enzyme [Clostridia bacterium]|nr:aminoacetone oxidase family FAD-binding enzyme [Clostridia bacterium]
MEKYEVIIIGAGASGIMCALNSTKKTLLLEASDRIGKKILATGNGKCNLTNDKVDAQYYNTPLVESYFQKFNQVQTLQYFEKLGVLTYADTEGRRYPLSNSANTVLDLLLKALQCKNNVVVKVSSMPSTITKTPNGFQVVTSEQTYVCQQLVIATGGNSSTQYLKQLHVDYTVFRPSLVGIKTTRNQGLAGVRVSHVRVKSSDFDEVGEILFKEDGISGIVIFNLSAHLARQHVSTGKIIIDLLPNWEAKRLAAVIQASIAEHPAYYLVDILEGLLHKSLARNIVTKLHLASMLARDCTATDVSALVNMIKNFVVIMTGYADNQQVYTGGVDLKDLDEYLQYQPIPGLFFIGEVVNVDGVCGGYNLQWAWTSSKIVGDFLSSR